MLGLPEFLESRCMKVVRLSSLRIGLLNPQKRSLVLISITVLSRPQDHSAARTIKWMKTSNDSTGNWTRDLSACSELPQPTTPTRTTLHGPVFQNPLNAANRYTFFTRHHLAPYASGWSHTTWPILPQATLLCTTQITLWSETQFHHFPIFVVTSTHHWGAWSGVVVKALRY